MGNVVWCREGDISGRQCRSFTVRSQTFSDHFTYFSEKTIKQKAKKMRKTKEGREDGCSQDNCIQHDQLNLNHALHIIKIKVGKWQNKIDYVQTNVQLYLNSCNFKL